MHTIPLRDMGFLAAGDLPDRGGVEQLTLLRAGLVDGDTEAGVLASGQVAGLLEDLPSLAEPVETMISETAAAIDRTARLKERSP